MITKGNVMMLCIAFAFAVSACKKDPSCTGKNAEGEELFIVEGTDLCESQIDQQNGEYCDCED